MIYLVDWVCSNDRELVGVQVDLEGDSLLLRCIHMVVDLDGHTEAGQVVTSMPPAAIRSLSVL